MSKLINGLILVLKKIKRSIFGRIASIYNFFCSHARLRNRVFFYTIRGNGVLSGNIKCVYDAYDGEKVVFAKMLPHSVIDVAKAKWLLLTSKVVVTDDYLKYLRMVRLRKEQSVVQVWHACGAFKRFGLDAPSKLTRDEEIRTHSQYTDVCVSSDYVRRFYAGAFGVEMEVVKAIGSPRTDKLLDSSYRFEQRQSFFSKQPILENKKVFVYFPTFREDYGEITDFDPEIDWNALNESLENDEVFVVSRHPVMKKEFFESGSFSKIIDLTAEPTEELLAAATAVITDYSSIVFDASLLRIPTVFYCPDYDTYERSFYLDYETELPGKIVKNQEMLLDAVRSSLIKHGHETDSERFFEKEMSACDGQSTKRIVELINEHLNQ